MSGSTGLIGTALADSLRREGAEVLRLVRRPVTSAGEAQCGCVNLIWPHLLL